MAKSSSGRSAAGWDGRPVVAVAAPAAADVDVDVGVVGDVLLALLLGFTAVAAVEAPKPPPLLPPPPPPPPPRGEPVFFFLAALLLLPFPLAAPRAVEARLGRA